MFDKILNHYYRYKKLVYDLTKRYTDFIFNMEEYFSTKYSFINHRTFIYQQVGVFQRNQCCRI